MVRRDLDLWRERRAAGRHACLCAQQRRAEYAAKAQRMENRRSEPADGTGTEAHAWDTGQIIGPYVFPVRGQGDEAGQHKVSATHHASGPDREPLSPPANIQYTGRRKACSSCHSLPTRPRNLLRAALSTPRLFRAWLTALICSSHSSDCPVGCASGRIAEAGGGGNASSGGGRA